MKVSSLKKNQWLKTCDPVLLKYIHVCVYDSDPEYIKSVSIRKQPKKYWPGLGLLLRVL